MNDQKKYSIVTLGCRTNQYESQAFKDQLESVGFTKVKKNEIASVCIINTCTVTQSADSRSRMQIRNLIKRHPNSKVVVTGCMVEGNEKVIKDISENIELITNLNKENLLSIVYPEEKFPEFSIKRYNDHTRAFVKIQDGCNSFCTYCIIPYVRGRSRSRTINDILEEVQNLVENGYKEIVLTGINIGDFDAIDKKRDDSLTELVKLLDKVDGLERIRISSIDPDEITDDLLDAVVNGKKTCHSMHIVLQSGSNVILKRMNRKYTRLDFLQSIDRLKNASKRFTFTTDVIVGFPGETERDFDETLSIIKEVKFAKVHMFPYSIRKRTRAALYKDHLETSVIETRKRKLLEESEKEAFSLRSQYIGKDMWILTEGHSKSTSGHTDNFLNVELKDVTLPANTLAKVRLLENTPQGLLGSYITHKL